jgi:hypothetical protein
VETFTTEEVAAWLRFGRAKVYAALAKEHRIGVNVGGSAGWRFTEADRMALRDAMRPPPPGAGDHSAASAAPVLELALSIPWGFQRTVRCGVAVDS